MKATLEKIDSIQQAVLVEATAEEVNKAYDSVMSEMRKEVSLKGFRKGKVPDDMIIKHFEKELENDSIRKLVNSTYPEAIQSVGAIPLGAPSVEPKGDFSRGKDFSYRAVFEVYPEVIAKGYDKLSLEREKVEVEEEEVEAEIKRLQRMMTQLEPAPDGALGPEMVAMVDFSGTADGEEFPGCKSENYVVEFGAGNMLKEFEKQIEGMKAGEERAIQFDYPKDYFRAEIAGKRGSFNVKAKEIRKKVTPLLNDDFAKELGNYDSLKAVREDVKKRLFDIKERMQKNKMINQAIEKLVEEHSKLEVPSTVIEAELTNMLQQLKQRVEQQGGKFEDLKIEPRDFVNKNIEEARKRARGYMLVRAISEQEKVMVTDDEVEIRLKEISEETRNPVDKVRAEFEKDNGMEKLRAQLVFEKTLDLVVSKAKVKEVKPKKEKK